MKISFLKINMDKSKRLWGIVTFAISVAVILIIISFVCICNLKKDTSRNDLLSLSSYYAEYELSVFSNKNQNSYNIKEWYLKKDEKENFRIDFEDTEKKHISYILTNNSLKLKSDVQINSLDLDNYNISKENLISISTFFSIYNDVYLNAKNDDIKIENQVIDKNTKYCIYFNNLNSNNEIVKKYTFLKKNGMKVKKLELVIDTNTNLPVEYIIYSDNDNVAIGIKYNKFDIINKFDEKIFANFDK